MRLKRLFAAAAIAGGLVLAQAAVVTPAFADAFDMACNYDHVTFNACLNFTPTDQITVMTAHAGLDSFMSQGYAQQIIDHGGPFKATLWTDRGVYLADLSISYGWALSESDRLSIRLGGDIRLGGAIDENRDGYDGVYAQVSYFDYHIGTTKIFRTGIVRGEFADQSGGPAPGCFVLC
jgi:hypothetical protein